MPPGVKLHLAASSDEGKNMIGENVVVVVAIVVLLVVVDAVVSMS